MAEAKTKKIARKKKTAGGDNGHDDRAVLSALSALVSRSGMAAYLGKSYSGDRDLYTALGYKTDILYEDYLARYERQDIASTIIDAPAKSSWRQLPTITESDEEETPFENEWADINEKLQVYHYMARMDCIAGIGRYGVLLIGFNDGLELSQPITHATEVLYLMPYSESNASIVSFVDDIKDRRYALPETYNVNITTGSNKGSRQVNVHWSRIIHVAENTVENDVYGTPRLKKVFNRLEDLERIAGGSAEMFWRGAFPGMSFNIAADAGADAQAFTDLQNEIEEYLHGLKRYLRMQGVDIQELKQQVADPSKHIDIQFDLISAASRIPKRILLGSERGELASSQDERNWLQQIEERRLHFCETKILRPFVDRLIKFGVLSKPTEGYTVDWPDLLTQSDKDKAEVGEIKARALKAYVDAIGAESILPPDIFLRDFLNFNKGQIEQITLILKGMSKEANEAEL